MKQTFDYSKVLNEPIKIRQLTDSFYFKKPREIRKGVAFIVTFLILFVFFRGLINFISSFLPGAMYAIYIFVPYNAMNLLFKLKFDYKSPWVYLKDLFHYTVKIQLPKRKYCNDEPVDLEGKVIFEKVEE